VVLRHVADVDDAVLEHWPVSFVELVLSSEGRKARVELEEAFRTVPEVIEAMECVSECDLLLKAALRTPEHWTRRCLRLDPTETLIKKARTRPIGRVIKHCAPHPMLQVAAQPD
jgi:hypothetical protein